MNDGPATIEILSYLRGATDDMMLLAAAELIEQLERELNEMKARLLALKNLD